MSENRTEIFGERIDMRPSMNSALGLTSPSKKTKDNPDASKAKVAPYSLRFPAVPEDRTPEFLHDREREGGLRNKDFSLNLIRDFMDRQAPKNDHHSDLLSMANENERDTSDMLVPKKIMSR